MKLTLSLSLFNKASETDLKSEYESFSQHDLAAQARQGDTGALAALYELHRPAIFRFLYYRVGERELAEDLTSEVFLRMIRSLSASRKDGSLRAWLFQVARNLVIDHYRKNSGRAPVALEERLTSTADNPIASVEQQMTSEHLNRALSCLPDDQRDVVLLRFIAGMPLADTAQALEKTEDAVKGLQRRALIAMRELLNRWEVTNV